MQVNDLGQLPSFGLQKLFAGSNKRTATSIDDMFGVVNLESDTCVAVVSPTYELVQHREVIEAVREAIITETQIEPEIQASFENSGARMFCDLKIPSLNKDVAVGDTISFGVRVVNSTDATTPLKILPFTLRLACTNGMTHSEFISSVMQRHNGDVKGVLANLAEIVSQTVAANEDLIKLYRSWKTKTIPDFAGLVEVLDTNHVVIPKKYLKEVELATPETAWDFFNVLTNLNTFDEKRVVGVKEDFNKIIERAMTVVTGE